MSSERKHGLSTEQFPVSAYVGSFKNLKDLKHTALACRLFEALSQLNHGESSGSKVIPRRARLGLAGLEGYLAHNGPKGTALTSSHRPGGVARYRSSFSSSLLSRLTIPPPG